MHPEAKLDFAHLLTSHAKCQAKRALILTRNFNSNIFLCNKFIHSFIWQNFVLEFCSFIILFFWIGLAKLMVCFLTQSSFVVIYLIMEPTCFYIYLRLVFSLLIFLSEFMMICEAHHEILDNIFSEQFINLISNQLKVYIFI